jgi:hypothetical protein
MNIYKQRGKAGHVVVTVCKNPLNPECMKRLYRLFKLHEIPIFPGDIDATRAYLEEQTREAPTGELKNENYLNKMKLLPEDELIDLVAASILELKDLPHLGTMTPVEIDAYVQSLPFPPPVVDFVREMAQALVFLRDAVDTHLEDTADGID